jgi:hypothetical protein
MKLTIPCSFIADISTPDNEVVVQQNLDEGWVGKGRPVNSKQNETA